jgi:hypothetical protein
MFVTTIVYVAVWPSTNAAVWRLSISTSGAPATVVGSAATSFAAFASPGPVTVAEFVTAENAAGPTAVVTVNTALSPAARPAACVASSAWPVHANVQPEPDSVTRVSPAGSVSRTVIGPAIEAEPTSVTTSVYVPFWPTVKVAVWRFAIARSPMPCTAATSEALLFVRSLSPAPVSHAWFVTDGTAAGPTCTVSAKLVLSCATITPA